MLVTYRSWEEVGKLGLLTRVENDVLLLQSLPDPGQSKKCVHVDQR